MGPGDALSLAVGGLTVLLEFIPYLGATGMLILLTAAAFSQFDALGHILLVPGTYLVIAALQITW